MHNAQNIILFMKHLYHMYVNFILLIVEADKSIS